jgi:hypothetical protein
MAYIVLDAQLFRDFPEDCREALRMIGPYKRVEILPGMYRYEFDSKKFSKNEIVLVRKSRTNDTLCLMRGLHDEKNPRI